MISIVQGPVKRSGLIWPPLFASSRFGDRHLRCNEYERHFSLPSLKSGQVFVPDCRLDKGGAKNRFSFFTPIA